MELMIKNLTKKFGEFSAVSDISITLRPGVFGLLGVNGAGKTTFMRMLTTLLEPTEGSITLNGRDIFKMDGNYRKLVGYLPQDFGFYPDFTVWDYLMYIASIKGIPNGTAKARVKKLIRLTGLQKVCRRKMKKLSGGMKRRAGIAQAMLNDPKVLILDEPTAGLDPNERIRFRNLISELSADRIVLLSTHIVPDVEYIADRILLMKEGHLICSGTIKEVIDSMTERVFSITAGRGEVDQIARRYRIANMRTDGDKVKLRILSDQKPAENAECEEKCLEDVFLYYFGVTEVESDDVL